MVVFKQAKKPLIRAGAAGAEVSSLRPAYAEKTPPCIAHCPNGNRIRDWVVPLAQHEAYGRDKALAFETAWRTITTTNPFPAICGRVCQHPCESSCNRKGKDGAVAVHLLERAVGDYAVANGLKLATAVAAKGAKVAVVGAGPAGLACAYHLARQGYAVTLFDAAPAAGGMMRYRVPRTLIPGEILDAEIANVISLGVDFRPNTIVGRDISRDDLLSNFKAIFFAVGLQKPVAVVPTTEQDVVVAGQLPTELPTPPAAEPTEVELKAVNTVSIAIAQGRTVAESIMAALERRDVNEKPSESVIKSDRMKLSWYPAATPHLQNAATGIAEGDVIEEAKRCLSCGMCMDCETCWMFCTSNCFVKLPKGEHYKIKAELCNGCKKCAEACPCGYIEMN